MAVIALAVSAASLLAAQGAPELERIQQPLEAARAKYAAARRAWQEDSIRRSDLPTVARVSAMAILADTTLVPPTFVHRLTAILTEEIDATRPSLGAAADSLLAGTRLTLVWRSAVTSSVLDPRTRSPIDAVTLRTNVDGREMLKYMLARDIEARELRRFIRNIIKRRLDAQTSPLVMNWSGGPIVQQWTPADRAIHYRMMRLAATPVSRACLDGSLAACKAALAMVPAGTDTISLWYDAASQRERVRRSWVDTMTDERGARIPLHVACVHRGQDSACRELLSRIGVRSPTSRSGRAELLRLALVVGGDGAVDRLRSSTALSIEALLDDVSGGATDSVITRWRADVLQGRPPSPAPTPSAWLWGSVGAVIALGATARWGARS
jgi:hypothetical protein